MKVPSNSGAMVVTVNTITSLNNQNSNTITTNKEIDINNDLSKDYTDDRYLSVWNLGNYFNGTDGEIQLHKPVMTADKYGNLYASWSDQSNSQIKFSYGVSKLITAIFRCYDQPATYTGISFDQKGTSNSANVGFMAEHQGKGATFSNFMMSSAMIIGGAGTIQITEDDISNQKNYSGGTVQVTGNPKHKVDSTNKTAYYNLCNYDMNRQLGVFNNPRSARYGNYLHNIWYDESTKGLKYSVSNVEEVDKYDSNAAAVVGWVVIDGGYSGQDRVHDFSTTYGNKINNTLGNGTGDEHPTLGNKTYDATYNDNIFVQASASSGATSISTGNISVDSAPEKGDTIALVYNSQGAYKITLKTITNVTGNNPYTIEWDGALTHDVNSITIYGGNMNVVSSADKVSNITTFKEKAKDVSSAAGKSADIDVTKDGYPVIAYFDQANSELKVAVANKEEPRLAEDWTRYSTGKKCSGEVRVRVDNNNGIHIMYKGSSKLRYIYSQTAGGLVSATEEDIDSNGSLSYGSISVKEVGNNYVPCVTYLNEADGDDCIKYAEKTSEGWDYQIIPSLGSGHYAVSENTISLESRKTTWGTDIDVDLKTVLQNGGKQETPTPKNVDSVLAFKTDNTFETAYLKAEEEYNQ